MEGLQEQGVGVKPKRCRVCGKYFEPLSSMAKACSVHCALEIARKVRAKAEEKAKRADRKELREARQRTKTRGDHMKELQAVFNEWIRLRDADRPCISCGRYHKGQWHAGHFQSVGSEPALRFEPDNVHKQCKPCNTDKHGNLLRYRERLIKRIGLERVEWLEGPHEPKKLSLAEIQEMKAFYRAEVRRMKKQAA
jgi:hypothetical protein